MERSDVLTDFEEENEFEQLRRNAWQTCAQPPESKLWRKDPRSIPKVFLIDAYEVSWRARTDKVAHRHLAIRPNELGPPLPIIIGIRQTNTNAIQRWVSSKLSGSGPKEFRQTTDILSEGRSPLPQNQMDRASMTKLSSASICLEL